MADRWFDEYIEIELNKPPVLRGLLEKGFDLYGIQEANEVYKLGNELVLYSHFYDKILCRWDLEKLMNGLESE